MEKLFMANLLPMGSMKRSLEMVIGQQMKEDGYDQN